MAPTASKGGIKVFLGLIPLSEMIIKEHPSFIDSSLCLQIALNWFSQPSIPSSKSNKLEIV